MRDASLNTHLQSFDDPIIVGFVHKNNGVRTIWAKDLQRQGEAELDNIEGILGNQTMVTRTTESANGAMDRAQESPQLPPLPLGWGIAPYSLLHGLQVDQVDQQQEASKQVAATASGPKLFVETPLLKVAVVVAQNDRRANVHHLSFV